jgi:hypothetical protein
MKTKQTTPTKPKVKEPAVWSWEVQEMAASCANKAIQGIINEEHPSLQSASWRVQYTNIIQESLRTDPAVQREIYERVCHFVDRVSTTPRTRAEVKLLTWLRIYADYP